MTTANEKLFDAALRHQVALRRYTAAELREFDALLEQSDADLVRLLRDRLAQIVGAETRRTQRLRELIRDVREMRRSIQKRLRGEVTEDLELLAVREAAWEANIIQQSVPVTLALTEVSPERLASVVRSKPLQGRLLEKWFSKLAVDDQSRLEQALRLGVANGEGVDDIVRRVVGTRARRYADGILSVNRRDARAVVRTAINHTANAAREAVWEANSNVVETLRWTSTLDGRTSHICQARDGKVAFLGEVPSGATNLLQPQGARPPAHINCRSTMVAVLSADGVIRGERPFVADERTGRQRQQDFRADARAQAGDRWRSMSREERNEAVRRVRERFARERIGRVSADTTYPQWLARQDREFQDATLGPSRAKLFRSGKLELEDFVDRGGRTRTLEELDDLIERRKGVRR